MDAPRNLHLVTSLPALQEVRSGSVSFSGTYNENDVIEIKKEE
jgi:hypothetical protein